MSKKRVTPQAIDLFGSLKSSRLDVSRLSSKATKGLFYAVMGTFFLTACATEIVEAPPPPVEPVIIVAPPPPPPEPAINIISREEFERRIAAGELVDYTRRTVPAVEVVEPEVVEAAPIVEATPKTFTERFAELGSPDDRIAFLADESPSDEATETDLQNMLLAAYQEKLSTDRAADNPAGTAEALVFLGDIDATQSDEVSKVSALKKFAEAQTLDPDNSDAASRVSGLRRELSGYADGLHEEALSFFVNQDFAPAVERWTTVLLIDPGNSAARNWFTRAKTALAR